ncbi:hypothetical protein L9F63_008551 [Diploptera punctata]|uniref:RUN domain-containing protein n=1 Tax=Diploptera punctata TaxID=6984 RepID=A0AAD7Z4G3_DIPPU|nr:hypothetical protein L9F63_008551 [Diploptera punctata]
MEIHDEKNGVKGRILDDLGKSIKLIQRYAVCGYEGVVVIGNDSWLVQSLCHLLDLILRHGLRDQHRGYWPIVRELSHSDTLHIIQNLKSVTTSLGKGRAWLYHTLTEGSLQSYLYCVCHDLKILHRYYVAQAILRDTSRTQQLFTLLAGLEQVQFNLDPDVAYLDMAAYQQHHSEVSADLLPSCGDPSRMTSSITSSLASPVDSGVALLDSDADATSVSEATINETDTLSLRDDKEDDSTFNEMEDNRINHELQSLEACASEETGDRGCDCAKDDIPVAQAAAVRSVMTASDIANQNINEDTPTNSFVESKNRLNILEDEKGCVNKAKKCESEDIVYRRQRSKKKRNSAVDGSGDPAARVKRVSFHEDFINESDLNKKGGSEFSVSFLPPNSVIKRDAVKGRYSWCGEGDAPFVRKKNENDTKSDVYLSSSSTLTSSSNDTICPENCKKVSGSSNARGSETSQAPPVAERGTPEGQEDPPNSASNLYLNRKLSSAGLIPEAMHRLSGSLKMLPSFDWSSDNESIPASDTEFVCSRTGHLISSSFNENCLMDRFTSCSSLVEVSASKRRNRMPLGLLPSRDVASKTSLFNKFMKSITERKFVKRKPKVMLRPSRSLYITWNRKLNHMEMMENFRLELDAHMAVTCSVTTISTELEKTLQTQVSWILKKCCIRCLK